MDIRVRGRGAVAVKALLLGVAFVAAPFLTGAGQAGDGDQQHVAFTALFVLVGLGVVARGLRDAARMGFRVDHDGIHGAHHAERDVVPWSQVSRLGWGEATETRRRASRNVPVEVTGNVIYAHLTDGRKVRVTQRLTNDYADQEQIDAQLRAAVARGLVPVPVGPVDLPRVTGGADEPEPIHWPGS